MRPSFERHLREYGKLIKDQMSAEDSEALERLETVIEYHMERAAKTQETTTGEQEKVFEIQKEKQRIMERLHENLRCLDDENCTPERPEGSRLVTFDEKENKFLVEMPNGSQETATLGDILTDGDWGLVYYLDPQSVSRMAQKKFFVESAKRELRDLLDEQLAVGRSIGREGSGMRGIVQKRRIIELGLVNLSVLKKGTLRVLKGFIAEVVVRNFFQQLYINGLIPFRVVESDVYQDAVEKIDFIIHIEKHRRGVEVEADDKVFDIGVQFTIGKTGGKNSQINKVRGELIESGVVDDIILVRFPIENLMRYYR